MNESLINRITGIFSQLQTNDKIPFSPEGIGAIRNIRISNTSLVFRQWYNLNKTKEYSQLWSGTYLENLIHKYSTHHSLKNIPDDQLSEITDLLSVTKINKLIENTAYIEAMIRFSRSFLHIDFESKHLIKLLKETLPVRRFRNEYDKPIPFDIYPFDLHYGEVDIQFTTDLEHPEHIIQTEWLIGDQFYSSSPDSGNYEKEIVSNRIRDDCRRLGLDGKIDEQVKKDLTRKGHFFENIFLEGDIRDKYLTLRHLHVTLDYLFGLKITSHGLEAFRFYESVIPNEKRIKIYIRVDANEVWYNFFGYSNARNQILGRLTFAVSLVRQLMEGVEFSSDIDVLVYYADKYHKFEMESSKPDFNLFMAEFIICYALTGLSYNGSPTPTFNKIKYNKKTEYVAEIRIVNMSNADISRGAFSYPVFTVGIDCRSVDTNYKAKKYSGGISGSVICNTSFETGCIKSLIKAIQQEYFEDIESEAHENL